MPWRPEPWGDAVLRVLGCLEMGSGWCFKAKHVAGLDNILADGISRWNLAHLCHLTFTVYTLTLPGASRCSAGKQTAYVPWCWTRVHPWLSCELVSKGFLTRLPFLVRFSSVHSRKPFCQLQSDQTWSSHGARRVRGVVLCFRKESTWHCVRQACGCKIFSCT